MNPSLLVCLLLFVCLFFEGLKSIYELLGKLCQHHPVGPSRILFSGLNGPCASIDPKKNAYMIS
jgi:hypothetical protein